MIIKLTSIMRQAVVSFSTVKFVMNVPVTSAGTNKRFSSFEITAADVEGINLNFAKIYPTIMRVNKNAV
jgi:hypothetical protein